MKSQVLYRKTLPRKGEFPEETLLFYDSVLTKNKFFSNWSKDYKFRIALKSGESLKTLGSFQAVLNKISKLQVPSSTKLTFLAAGGGSVGDFVGFVASIYQRGRPLVLVPSTWLSAVDSAHGGKNGLNFQAIKNQIGTFYPAHKIYVCEDLLNTQPESRLRESLGEVIKIAILSDAKLFKFLEQKSNHLSSADVYGKLQTMINLKYKIVAQDPFEKKGTRRLLNLGHTMGHVFESVYGWPHGICVLLGMQFSARWSLSEGYLPQKEFIRISMLIDSVEMPQSLSDALNGMSLKKISDLLFKDKKRTSTSEMDFIFIKTIGHCERKTVSVQSILNEVIRQKKDY